MSRIVLWVLALSLRQAPTTAPVVSPLARPQAVAAPLQEPRDRGENPPAPRLTREQISALVTDLGSPRYNVRENATQALCRLRENDLPFLVERYKSESRYERKLRIRYVIEYVFHQEQILGRNGFMGMRPAQLVVPELIDPVSGRTTRGVVVSHVVPGFPADRAGLRDGDVVIALDGEPVPEDPQTTTFVERIASRAPGTMLSLRVLRPVQPRKVQFNIGPEPAKFKLGAKLSLLPADLNEPKVWVTDVEDKKPAALAGIQPNEIIRALNDKPLRGYAVNQVEDLLRTLPPNSTVLLDVVPTQTLTLNIRLTARPPEFINPKDLPEMRIRFMRWWQDQGGDLPPRSSVDASARAAWGSVPALRFNRETSLLP